MANTATRLSDLPPEVLHLIIDGLAFQHVLDLLSLQNRHLISSVLGHHFWGSFLDGVRTYRDASDLASTFTAMRDMSNFMLEGGPAALEDRYNDRDSVTYSWRTSKFKYAMTEQWSSSGMTWPVAPYARYSRRELSWNRASLYPIRSLLSNMLGSKRSLRAFGPPDDANFHECRRLDSRSSSLRRFLDAMQDEDLVLTTWSSTASLLPDLFKQLDPEVRKWVRNASTPCPPAYTMMPKEEINLTSLTESRIAKLLPKEEFYHFLTKPLQTSKYDPYRGEIGRPWRDFFVEQDHSSILQFTNEAVATLSAKYLSSIALQKLLTQRMERSLERYLSRLSVDVLGFFTNLCSKARPESCKIEDLPMPSTQSDFHLVVDHPTFWQDSARGALRKHKQQQLLQLAELHKRYPYMLRLPGDSQSKARLNQTHIYLKLLHRAKKLGVWDPFKRSPHRRDTLEYSNVWLLPFDKHLNFAMRKILRHPIDLTKSDLSENVQARIVELAHTLQQQLGIEDLTAPQSFSHSSTQHIVHEQAQDDAHAKNSPSHEDDRDRSWSESPAILDRELPLKTAAMPVLPHRYPEDIISKLSLVFAATQTLSDHGRNTIPWISKTPEGVFRSRGPLLAQKKHLSDSIMDRFKRGEADIAFMAAFLDVVEYVRAEFATAEEREMLFRPASVNRGGLARDREARRLERSRLKEEKKRREPRLYRAPYEKRGTKSMMEYERYKTELWETGRHEAWRYPDHEGD